MSTAAKHSFSIEQSINPLTKLPFGNKYSGVFSIRRPSLLDRTIVAQKELAEKNAFGNIPPGQLPQGLDFAAYIFHFVSTITDQDLPEWFDRALIFDDNDEAAFGAVWDEVQKFQDSFRSSTAGTQGRGNGENSQVLVSAALPIAAN